MTTELERLFLRFDATIDPLDRKLATVDRRLDRSGKSAERMERRFERSFAGINKNAVLGVVGVTAFASGMRALVRNVADFEASMSAVSAVSGATGRQLAELENQARSLGATTIFSAKEAAEGMEFLARAGFSTNAVMQALPATLDLAAAGKLELGRAADIASNVMSAFQINAAETTRVVDVMAHTSRSANTDIEQFGEAMKLVAPVAYGFNVSLEETSAVIGVLSDAGLQATVAGTGLRQIITQLANVTPASEAVLASYGLTIEQVNPATQGLSNTIALLAERGISAADSMAIFGQRGGPAFNVAAQGIPKIRRLTEELNDADGVARQMAKTMQDNLQGSLKSLNSAWSETQLLLGDGLGDGFRASVDGLTSAVRLLNDNFDVLGNVAATAAAVVGTHYTIALTKAIGGQVALAAGTLQVQIALGRMAGQTGLASAGLLSLTAATKAAGAAFRAFIPLAAVATIYELIDGNESLVASEKRLGEELEKTKAVIDLSIQQHGVLTDQAKEQVQERIAAYIEEVKALEEVLAAQLDNRTQAGLLLRGIYDVGRETIGEGLLGYEYQSLEEAYEQQNQYNRAIAEMRKLLNDADDATNSLKRSTQEYATLSEKELKQELERQLALADIPEKREAALSRIVALQNALAETKPPSLPPQVNNELIEYQRELGNTVSDLEQLAAANEESAEAYESLSLEIEARNEALEQGLKLGSDEYNQTVALIKQREQLEQQIDETTQARQQETEEAKRFAEENAQIYKDLSTGITDQFSDVFSDFYRGDLNEWRDYADSIEDIFARTLANITTAALAKPVIIPVVQAFAGGLGADQTAIDSLTREFGGTPGASVGLSDLSSVSSFLDIGSDIGSSITNYIDQAAFDVFGTGTSAAQAGASYLPAGVQGPVAPADAVLSRGVTDAFNATNLAAGFAGNLAADLAGLSGEYSSLGSAAATAAAALAGFTGPLAFGLAAFGGSALAGAFGGSRPHPASNAGATGFDARGRLVGVELSSNHTSTEAAQGLVDVVNGITQSLTQAGLDLTSIASFQTGVDDGRGFFSFGDFKGDRDNPDLVVNFDPEDEQSVSNALSSLATLIVKRVDAVGGEVDAGLLERLDAIETEGRAVGDVIADIGLITNFDKIGESFLNTEEPVNQFVESMEAFRDEIQQLEESVQRLDLPLDQFQERISEVETAIGENFNESVIEQIAAISSPALSALNAEYDRHAQLLESAAAVGGDVALVNQLHQQRLQEIYSQYDEAGQALASTVSALDDFIADLKVGDLGNATPLQQFEQAQQAYQDALAAGTIGEDQSTARDFLNTARQYLGSGEEYSAIFEGVLSELESARDAASDELTQQQKIAQNTLNTQLAVDNLNTALASSNLLKNASLANPNVLVSADNANEQIIRDLASYTSGQRTAALQLLEFATPSVAAGEGRRSIFLEQDRLANSSLREALAAAGVPGFLNGGVISGGRIGYDDVPILASAGEYMINRASARQIGLPVLQHLNATGTLPDNDNNAMLSAVRDEVRQTRRAMIDVANHSANQRERQAASLARIDQTNRLRAAR